MGCDLKEVSAVFLPPFINLLPLIISVRADRHLPAVFSPGLSIPPATPTPQSLRGRCPTRPSLQLSVRPRAPLSARPWSPYTSFHSSVYSACIFPNLVSVCYPSLTFLTFLERIPEDGSVFFPSFPLVQALLAHRSFWSVDSISVLAPSLFLRAACRPSLFITDSCVIPAHSFPSFPPPLSPSAIHSPNL